MTVMNVDTGKFEYNTYECYCPECGTVQSWEGSESDIVAKTLECAYCSTVFSIKRIRKGGN